MTAAASTALVAAAPPSPAPSSSPAAPPYTPAQTHASPGPSQLARDFAQRMRTFDADLSHKQLEQIAAGIDDNLQAGKFVNPGGKALKNWDEPVTVFEVEG